MLYLASSLWNGHVQRSNVVYCWVEETDAHITLFGFGWRSFSAHGRFAKAWIWIYFRQFRRHHPIIPEVWLGSQPHGTVFVWSRAGTSIAGDLVETRVWGFAFGWESLSFLSAEGHLEGLNELGFIHMLDWNRSYQVPNMDSGRCHLHFIALPCGNSEDELMCTPWSNMSNDIWIVWFAWLYDWWGTEPTRDMGLSWSFMASSLVASGAQLQMGGPICLRRSLHLGKIGKSREDLGCSISGNCWSPCLILFLWVNMSDLQHTLTLGQKKTAASSLL